MKQQPRASESGYPISPLFHPFLQSPFSTSQTTRAINSILQIPSALPTNLATRWEGGRKETGWSALDHPFWLLLSSTSSPPVTAPFKFTLHTPEAGNCKQGPSTASYPRQSRSSSVNFIKDTFSLLSLTLTTHEPISLDHSRSRSTFNYSPSLLRHPLLSSALQHLQLPHWFEVRVQSTVFCLLVRLLYSFNSLTASLLSLILLFHSGSLATSTTLVRKNCSLAVIQPALGSRSSLFDP